MSQETLTERGRAPRAGLGTLDVMASPEDRRLKEMIKSSLFGDLSAPVRIGRFTVTEQLGSGGMGVVYAARDEELDRKVAIKLLRSDQGDQGDQGDQARARLLREARAMARLSHPNVVTIHEVGSYDDQVFLAMEYLEGEDLAACLARERRLPWAEARALALQLCDALAAMHERGLVHRDIKPHNIFLVTPPGRSSTPRRPRVKVLDFGIAKLTRADASSVHSSSAAGGELVGTAAYIAPEQARAGAVDGRADIYAVGLVLYELLTGRVPFSAPTFMAVVSQHLSEPPPPPRAVAPDADIPDDVERLILRCLEKQPDDRYADVHELLAALRAIPEAPADPVAVAAAVAPRRPALLGALGAVLVLGLGFVVVPRALDGAAGAGAVEPGEKVMMDPPRDAEASVSASRETAVAGASRAPDAALTGAEAAPDDAAADEESEGGGEVEPMADDDSPEAKPKARALPTTLDERALHRVLRRRAREVRRCGQQNGGLPNTRFEVRFTVRRSGDVEQATVEDPLLSPPLRRCLEAVVLRTRFPQAQEPTSGRYTFSF